MKNIITILITLLSLVTLFSCDRDEEKAVLSPNPSAPAITTPASGSTIALAKADANNIINFVYNPADFGFNASVRYVIQIDKQNNHFAKPVKLGTSDKDTFTISVGNLNKSLLDLGFAADSENTFELRIGSIVHSSIDTVFSPVYTYKATPYSTLIIISPIYLLGDGSEAGWNNNTNLMLKPTGNGGEFFIYAKLTSGKYIKFIGDQGQWAPMWGTDANGTSASGSLVYRPKESDPDPASIPTPAASGTYKITADTAKLTYKIEAYNIGLVGSATPNGWNAPDSKMTYDITNGVWKITLDLIVGKIKFRLNDDWAWNLGGDITDLTQGGADIDIPTAGNYTIVLNIAQTPYTATITKN